MIRVRARAMIRVRARVRDGLVWSAELSAALYLPKSPLYLAYISLTLNGLVWSPELSAALLRALALPFPLRRCLRLDLGPLVITPCLRLSRGQAAGFAW